METKLYHKDVFMPKSLYQFCPTGEFPVEYSEHALEAAQNDRYGCILLTCNLKLEKSHIIEVEVTDKRVSKVLYRLPYTSKFDLMVALVPNTHIVKTVWLNCKSDCHKTLDILRYDRI
jgi:hypothetical protein